MIGLCLGALSALAAGAPAVTIPTDDFTLAWMHSVERVEWQEDYRATGDRRLVLTEARVKGSGAGMEPPEGAVLAGGWWHYHPKLTPLDHLALTRSRYTRDYRLCWRGQCRPLAELVPTDGDGSVTALWACAQAPR